MGMDLISLKNRRYAVSLLREAWASTVSAAEDAGWAPRGAVETNYEDIRFGDKMNALQFGGPAPGGYLGNDWQAVTDEDAADLAAALERAIVELQRELASVDHRHEDDDDDDLFSTSPKAQIDARIAGLERVLQIAKLGAFLIG